MGPNLIDRYRIAIDEKIQQRVHRVLIPGFPIGPEGAPEVDSEPGKNAQALCTAREVIAAAPQLVGEARHTPMLAQNYRRVNRFRNSCHVHVGRYSFILTYSAILRADTEEISIADVLISVSIPVRARRFML
jgi:hypothetical protein